MPSTLACKRTSPSSSFYLMQSSDGVWPFEMFPAPASQSLDDYPTRTCRTTRSLPMVVWKRSLLRIPRPLAWLHRRCGELQEMRVQGGTTSIASEAVPNIRLHKKFCILMQWLWWRHICAKLLYDIHVGGHLSATVSYTHHPCKIMIRFTLYSLIRPHIAE